MKIVINSSPLIFLGKLEFLELFLETEDEFYVPTAVIEEIQAKDDLIISVINPLIETGKLQVRRTTLLSLLNRINQSLGQGESEAISLATELQQDLRKHAIYSVSKVGDRIPMIIAIALKSPNYLFSPQFWGLGG